MKTTIVYFCELGYMTQSQCETIKRIMESQTYMKFKVSYSNNCGNCTLMCSTDYNAPKNEVRNLFLAALVGKMAMMIN